MYNELENYVEKVAENIIQQQMLSFSSHAEAQKQFEKTKLQVRQSIQHNDALFLKGLNYLIELKQGYVSTVAVELLKYLHEPEQVAAIIESQVMKNTEALPLFMEAMNHFYDCGDFAKERCVIAVFMGLFPMHPQPYIYLGTLIWRKDGIDEAESFYAKLIDALEDPALDYFAADCFYENGNTDKAKQILYRALRNTELSPVMYSDIRQQILALLERC
jgi:tetratricopeptide (TPR) repeat protein